MNTNFALSLSVAGIKLLHRVTGGWHLVGEVGLDSTDLGGDLAKLRCKAMQLDPSGMRTKLLIPNDQIKYLSLDTTRTDIDDIHAALEGATPYALDELVIDFDRSGGRTHIAAVARETLDEAEAFAVAHDFAPVCSAAIAEDFTFSKEVFFGPTAAAAGILGSAPNLSADSVPVKVIGVATLPEVAEPVAAGEPEPPEVPEVPELPDEPDVPALPEEPEQPAAPPETAAPDLPELDDAPMASDFAEADDVPEVVFASKARPNVTEVAAPAPTTPSPAADATVTDDDAAPAEPMFTRRTDQPALAVPVGPAKGPAIAAPASPAPPAAPKPVVSTAPELPSAAPAVTGGSAPAVTATPKPVDSALAAPARPTPPPGTGGGFASRRKAKAADAPKQPATEKTDIFKAAPVGGKPRYLGLILTAVLLLVLTLVVLWAGTLTEEARSRWFGTDVPAPVAVATVAPEVAEDIANQVQAATAEALETAAAAQTNVGPTPETPTQLPEVAEAPATSTTPAGPIPTPEEADRFYAATGVWLRAPRLPIDPRSDVTSAAPDGRISTKTPPIAQPALPAIAGMSPDLRLPQQPNPPAAGTVFARDANGFIQATPEGALMPSGAFVIAGRPAIVPPARQTALPVAAATPDIAIEAPTVPAPEGGDVVLVFGAPPSRPPERPATTLTTDAEATAESTAPVEILAPDSATYADARPRLRPEGIAPADVPEPEQTLALAADPALAGKRPNLRPAGLAPAETVVADTAADETELAEEPDVAAIAAAIAAAAPVSPFVDVTNSAIASSRRPDPRPRNFATVVARATDLAARQASTNTARQTAAAVVQTPAAPSSGPTPGSVAQAATLDNAIRLRDINLIGVYGRPNARRALVRLANGRYVKVEVGSSLDGGRVTAIGDNALNYVKRSRTYVLELPTG